MTRRDITDFLRFLAPKIPPYKIHPYFITETTDKKTNETIRQPSAIWRRYDVSDVESERRKSGARYMGVAVTVEDQGRKNYGLIFFDPNPSLRILSLRPLDFGIRDMIANKLFSYL